MEINIKGLNKIYNQYRRSIVSYPKFSTDSSNFGSIYDEMNNSIVLAAPRPRSMSLNGTLCDSRSFLCVGRAQFRQENTDILFIRMLLILKGWCAIEGPGIRTK